MKHGFRKTNKTDSPDLPAYDGAPEGKGLEYGHDAHVAGASYDEYPAEENYRTLGHPHSKLSV